MCSSSTHNSLQSCHPPFFSSRCLKKRLIVYLAIPLTLASASQPSPGLTIQSQLSHVFFWNLIHQLLTRVAETRGGKNPALNPDLGRENIAPAFPCQVKSRSSTQNLYPYRPNPALPSRQIPFGQTWGGSGPATKCVSRSVLAKGIHHQRVAPFNPRRHRFASWRIHTHTHTPARVPVGLTTISYVMPMLSSILDGFRLEYLIS